jgi:hypothetical protein
VGGAEPGHEHSSLTPPARTMRWIGHIYTLCQTDVPVQLTQCCHQTALLAPVATAPDSLTATIAHRCRWRVAMVTHTHLLHRHT